MDVAARSALMSRIRGKGNRSTEIRLIAIMRELRVRGWRRGSQLPGRPDFVFPAQRVALFVDGCFWHGCPRHYTRPSGNAEFWERKVTQNRLRDRRVDRSLRMLGWRVVRIWEHELVKSGRGRLARRLARVVTPARRPR
ncbi:MAG: very short patch repair endonuclease [Candidatus Didemnitutus sp.]|nr:very short patch repair endonuclease [Candidatus Didemnitutus sp.]